MPLYGLIGYPLAHSFSKKYFTNKFASEGLRDCFYENFEINNITDLKNIVATHPDLRGLNVTLPYKTSVIPLLDDVNATAAAINAVNTIAIQNGKLTGYNTDCIGFKQSLTNFIGDQKPKALILGTGGAAQAVSYVLKNMGINYLFVSRSITNENTITYARLTTDVLLHHLLIINCTPLGKLNNENGLPPIDYTLLSPSHLLFDLNYNPTHTLFMQMGTNKKCAVKNGYEMLVLQAEASWRIWND